MRIGFIGAGLMGQGMAACMLGAGHSVSVLAHRNRAPVEELLGKGASEVASVQALAGEMPDVIALCLPNSDVVEQVLGEMEPQLAPGTIILDATTAHPASTIALHARLAKREVHLCDAPVTGGPAQARDGQLTALVGAEEKLFARVVPVIETYTRQILHTGGPGTGHTAKLLNNMVTQGTVALLAEAYTVARQCGVDWSTLHAAMLGGAARSGTFDKMVTPALQGNYRGAAFAIANAEKDVRYYCTFREGSGASTPIARAVQAMLARACEAGHGERFVSELLDPCLSPDPFTISEES